MENKKIVIGIIAVFIVIVSGIFAFAYGCSDPYKEWIENELANQQSATCKKIKQLLNGATIGKAEVSSCKTSSSSGTDYVTFVVNVAWQGSYNTKGTVTIEYTYKSVSGQLQYHEQKIISQKNPSVAEYCSYVAEAINKGTLSNRSCEQRKRIENKQNVTVKEAFIKQFSVETFGNTNDTGINGSNISRIAIEYRMKWDSRFFTDHYTDLAYVYAIKNGRWEHLRSGITATDDPEQKIVDFSLETILPAAITIISLI